MIVSAAPESQCQEPEEEEGRQGGKKDEGKVRKGGGGLVGDEGRERRESRVSQ